MSTNLMIFIPSLQNLFAFLVYFEDTAELKFCNSATKIDNLLAYCFILTINEGNNGTQVWEI